MTIGAWIDARIRRASARTRTVVLVAALLAILGALGWQAVELAALVGRR